MVLESASVLDELEPLQANKEDDIANATMPVLIEFFIN